jgi:hypothetical protein
LNGGDVVMSSEQVWRPFPPLLQAAIDSILPADYVLGSRILKCFTSESYQVGSPLRFFPPASTFRRLITLMGNERSSKNSDFLFQLLVNLKEYFCSIPGYGWERSPFSLDDRLELMLHPFHLMGFDSANFKYETLSPFSFLKALLLALRENNCELVELTQYFDASLWDEEDIGDCEDGVELGEQLEESDRQSWKDGLCQILRYFLVVLEDPKACKAFYLNASTCNRVSEGKTKIFHSCLPHLVATLGSNDEKAASMMLLLCLQVSKKFNKEWDMAYIEELTRKVLVFYQPEPWKLFLSSIPDLQLRMTIIEYVFKSSFLYSLEIPVWNIDNQQSYVSQLVEWIQKIEVKENSPSHVEEELELLFLFLYFLLDSFAGLQNGLEEMEANFSVSFVRFLQSLGHLKHLWEEYTSTEKEVAEPFCYEQLENLGWFLRGVVLFNEV